jgi:hypothetical protein
MDAQRKAIAHSSHLADGMRAPLDARPRAPDERQPCQIIRLALIAAESWSTTATTTTSTVPRDFGEP